MNIKVRPSHIEAYQDEILSESAVFIPQANDLEGLMTESAICLPISESIEEINKYAIERSDNIKIVADMFHLDKIDCSLNENATRMNIKIDENTTANIPVESAINMQYADILGSIRNKKK